MEYKFTLGLNDDARLIREKVFVEEQGFNDEFDDIDSYAHHLVLYANNQAIATGRVFLKDKDTYTIGRVAVIKQKRNNNLGTKLLLLLEQKAKELDGKKIELSAQIQAKIFYSKLGYQEVGEIFLDEEVEHIKMIKKLD